MHEERQVLQVVPIGASYMLPALHLRYLGFHHGLCLLDCGIAEMGRLAVGETLLCLRQGLLRLAQTPKDGQRITLGHLMHEVEQIWDAQARQTGFSYRLSD